MIVLFFLLLLLFTRSNWSTLPWCVRVTLNTATVLFSDKATFPFWSYAWLGYSLSRLRRILIFAQGFFFFLDWLSRCISDLFYRRSQLATSKQPEKERSKHTSVTIATAHQEYYGSETADWGREADRRGACISWLARVMRACKHTTPSLNVCISQWEAAEKKTSAALSKSFRICKN